MTPTPRVVRALFLSAALTVASTGCTSTETGNPPAQPETGLDAGRITLFTIPNMCDPCLLSGMADKTLTTGGTLRVTAVETDLPAAVISAKTGAELLDVSERQWHRLVQRGLLPRPIKLGRNTRWRMAEVEAALEAINPAEV